MRKPNFYFRFLFLLFPVIFSFAQEKEKGIAFHHGIWSEVMAAAKKQDKLIFVDAYTSWCGPCKWMAKNIFPNDTVAGFYNNSFINYKLDMEKGEGIAFAKTYNVRAYPTFLYIDGEGNMMHKAVGSREAGEFIELGKNALNPNTQLASLKKKYAAGEKNPQFLREYANALASASEKSGNVANEYLATQSEKDLLTKENVLFILMQTEDINSREFRLLLANKEKFEELSSKESVAWKISDVGYNAVAKAAENKEEALFQKTLEIIKSNLKESDKIVSELSMRYYKASSGWKKYAEAAAVYADKYAMENAGELNNIAWDFYEHVDDKALLEKAEKWIAKSVQLEEGYASMDTYGCVLAKLGKKEEAVKKLELAIELAKKSGDDYKATEELLTKLKSGK